MSLPDEHEFFDKEAFYVFDDYFHTLAKPECAGCITLEQLTSSHALTVMQRLAVAESTTQPEDILADEAIAFMDRVSTCTGPKVVDHDTKLTAERLLQLQIFTPDFVRAAISRLLPVTEACGLGKGAETENGTAS